MRILKTAASSVMAFSNKDRRLDAEKPPHDPRTSAAASVEANRSRWYLGLAFVTGAFFLGLAVHQVDWRTVEKAVSHVSPGWLVMGGLGLGSTYILLAVRWRVLVTAGEQISLADALDFIMIGTLASLVLPSRLGDVARAVVAGRVKAISASRLLGTILVERLLDVIMLLGFGLALAFLMPIPAIVRGALTTLFVAALLLGVVLWMGEAGPLGVVTRWLGKMRGAASRGVAMFGRFVRGISDVRAHGHVPPAFGAAVAIWVCSALATTCNLRAFDIHAPWYAGAFVVIVVNLGGLIPAPPAGLGVYEYLTMLALSPWLGDRSTAFAFAVVSHAVSVAVVLALGSVSLVRQGLSIGALRRLADAGADSSRTS